MNQPAPANTVPYQIDIGHQRLCQCPPNHLNCMDAKTWLKSQLGVWEFHYEARDVRDKSRHPATYPIALARKCIDLFTHEGELVLDPFVGSGTTLIAARDANRNAVGFDLKPEYIALCEERLQREGPRAGTCQYAVQDDARSIPAHFGELGSVALILTSPPYANLLNRRRRNKSRRGNLRANGQLGKVEQYSQEPNDLGTLPLDVYQMAIAEIFCGLLPLLRPRGHCLINVPDMWWNDERITIHLSVIEALRSAGYELRNTIIWDRRNIVNRIGIFGWPNNYITMGVTFEYLLDFWRPQS